MHSRVNPLYGPTQLTGQASRLIFGKSTKNTTIQMTEGPLYSSGGTRKTEQVQVTRHPGLTAGLVRQPQRQVRLHTAMVDQHAYIEAS